MGFEWRNRRGELPRLLSFTVVDIGVWVLCVSDNTFTEPAAMPITIYDMRGFYLRRESVSAGVPIVAFANRVRDASASSCCLSSDR